MSLVHETAWIAIRTWYWVMKLHSGLQCRFWARLFKIMR